MKSCLIKDNLNCPCYTCLVKNCCDTECEIRFQYLLRENNSFIKRIRKELR